MREKEKGFKQTAHLNCDDYDGMVLVIGIRFDIHQSTYELDLQWECLALDFFGDTLQESYVYEFASIEKLLEYLEVKYNIKVTDIPIKYQFDADKHPRYEYDESKRPHFEIAWKRFKEDFKKNKFLEPSLNLIYRSSND